MEKSPALSWSGDRLALAGVLEKEPCPKDREHTCTARAPIGFVPGAKGPVLLKGVLAFSVCDPDQCLIEKVPLALALNVD